MAGVAGVPFGSSSPWFRATIDDALHVWDVTRARYFRVAPAGGASPTGDRRAWPDVVVDVPQVNLAADPAVADAPGGWDPRALCAAAGIVDEDLVATVVAVWIPAHAHSVQDSLAFANVFSAAVTVQDGRRVV